VRSAKGKGNLALTFNEELWVPVMDPPISRRVSLSVWDRNITTKNTLLGYAYFDYGKIRKKTTQDGAWGAADPQPFSPPQWVYFYGAPHELRTGKSPEFVAQYPEFASTYRGRLLVSMHVATKPSAREETGPHTKTIKYPLPSQPLTTRYTFRMFLIYGSEIPIFQGVTGAAKMGVRVLIGNKVITYRCKKNERGVVFFNETLEERDIDLPSDITQLPDIIVQLFKYPEALGPCVSFVRLKAAALLQKQFKAEPEWVTLMPDKVREGSGAGIPVDDHPGALLIKAGFGINEDAHEEQWIEDTDVFREKVITVLRVHIYQARDLPSADENGLLDPYVKIWFMGKKKKTKTMQETTAPLFYETLQFQERLPKDLRFAPEVVLQVWDSDFVGSNSPVGIVRMPLNRCTPTRVPTPTTMPPAPQWFALEDVNGKPGGGSVLVSFQVFTLTEAAMEVEDSRPIKPRTRSAWLEIVILGLRDLKKYGFSAINEPYIQFMVAGAHPYTTAASKMPTAKDPNYLERAIIPVELPEDPTFAPQLEIRVFDKRLGGLSQPLIGADCVNLARKLPWAMDYLEPLSMKIPDGRTLVTEQEEDDSADPADGGEEEEEEEEEDEGEEGAEGGPDEPGLGDTTAEPGTGGVQEAKSSGTEPAEAKPKTPKSPRAKGGPPKQEDTGTGLFPLEEKDKISLGRFKEDLEYEEQQKLMSKGKLVDLATFAFTQAGDKDKDLINFPQTWASSEFMDDRDWLVKDPKYDKKTIEEFLQTYPFERYYLYRGATRGAKTIFGDTSRRKVGKLKAIIKVCLTDPHFDNKPVFDIKKIQKTITSVVRLYVVKAEHLQPKDSNGKADPYIVVKLGKEKRSNRDHHCSETLDPEFYEMFEFQTPMPGPSQLKVQIYDYDRFLPDSLIGETIIDLEDRWFHPDWEAIGVNAKRADKVGPVKPLESRDLWYARSSNSQGQVQLWVDIMNVKQSRKFEAEKLEGPPKQDVEVRVICWKTENVRGKGVASITDLYVRFWMEGQRHQETDTHWRCKSGKASWNYRVKFPVTLPIKPDKGKLYYQVYDRDILFNELIAEGSIDLYKWFLMVYHRKASAKPFKELKDAKEKKAKGVTGAGLEQAPGAAAANPNQPALQAPAEGPGAGTGDDLAMDPRFQDFEWDKPEEDLEAGEGGDKKESEPLLARTRADEEEEGKGEEKKVDEKSSEDETKDFLNSIYQYLGIGEIADDAQWQDLIYTDHEAHAKVNRGRLALSIEIMPTDEADTKKAGYGRDDPNSNPYLPPPVGRMQFSLNPFTMLSELIGPVLLMKICCCICIILILVIVMLLGTYMSGLVSMIELLQGKV
jgi:hypothetical protein